jgi:cellulose biosynthesis protein BcsQ
MDGVAHTLAAVEKFNPRTQRIILPTLYQRQSLYDTNLQLLQEAYPSLVCTPVPHSAAVREAVAHGQTIWEFVARSETLTAAREVYVELTQRIIPPEASS